MTIAKPNKPQSAPPQPKGMPPQVQILQMMNAYRLTQNISVAAQLGIADLLAERPRSVVELAQETKSDPQSLYRLLRTLASFDIFAEIEAQKFRLTPRAALLKTDAPGSLRGYATVMGAQWHWQMWKDILHSVKTGESAFEAVYGMSFEDYYEQHPEDAKNFDAAMKGALTLSDRSILDSYDFSGFKQVVDLATGGQGDGELLATILQQNPGVTGIYFDTSARLENAKGTVEDKSVGERCELAGGDFFESVSAGGDAYIVKNLIHDYDDEKVGLILSNLRQAIADNGKLLIVEMIVPPGNEPSLAKILDVEAMIMTPGAIERTAEEYGQLLSQAGFETTRIIPTKSPMSIIEAIPV
ncbi:methyltransferase [Pleurocapsales cyanobacterium LEGE 10410]|nr:methyltransferase [Pleurocapsales cyanobacterium LEGE 10410]